MAQWTQPKYKLEPKVIRLGDGINTAVPPFDIADSEGTYLRNVGSDEYPALSVRPGRSISSTATSTNILGLGQRVNSYIMQVSNNTWKYTSPGSSTWTDIASGLSTSAHATIGDYVIGAASTKHYSVLMSTAQKKIWDGTSTAVNLGDANTPLTDKWTVHKGRIYALDGPDIDFSALNLPNDWTTAGDGGAGTINITRAKGNGTAIWTYANHVIAWTQFSMHELYGTGPLNYELVDVEGEIGCISQRSVCECNGRLYWVGHPGVYEYSGGSPKIISEPVKEYIDAINKDYRTWIASGSIDEFLYISIPYGSTATQNNLLLVFDTAKRKWFVETGSFVAFVTISNSLYGVDKDGTIHKLRDGTTDGGTAISWEFITKPFNEGAIGEKKSVSDMYVVAEVSTGSTAFTMGYSTNVENNDSSSFTTLLSLSGSSNTQNQRINVPLNQLHDVGWYRLRFAGSGPATVHFLQKNVRVKSR